MELLEQEGAQAVVPDLLDFFAYCFYNNNFKASHLGMKKSSATKGNLGIHALDWFRAPASAAFAKSNVFLNQQRFQIWQQWHKTLCLLEIRLGKDGF